MGPKGKTVAENSANVGALRAPPAERAPCDLVGLENQGATCYLNSLIQALYMTPELRRGLYTLDPQKDLHLQSAEEEDREKAAAREAERSIKAAAKDDPNLPPVNEVFLAQLTDMGCDPHGSRRALVAKSASFEEALDYYGQHDEDAGFKDPFPAAAPPAAAAKKLKKTEKPRQIPLELQRLFTQLQLLDQRAISTEALTTKGFQWQGYDGRTQHDAHELNRLLIDALEKSLVKTPQQELCKVRYFLFIPWPSTYMAFTYIYKAPCLFI